MDKLLNNTILLLCLFGAVIYGLRYATLALDSEASLFSLWFFFLFVSFFVVAMLLAFFLVRNVLFVPGQLLPSILISKLMDLKVVADKQLKANTWSTRGLMTVKVCIPTEDGIKLDALEIINSQATDKWVIWFNANGVPYEQNISFLGDYAYQVGCNVLTFNYRGVGESTGWPYQSSLLFRDGKSVIEYVKAKGIPEHSILLHGHSIGGGVLASVAHEFPNCKVVSDRSFRSLHATVQTLLRKGMSGFMGIVIGVTMGCVLYTLLLGLGEAAPPAAQMVSGLVTCLMLGVLAGQLLAATGIIDSQSSLVISMMDWHMQANTIPREKLLVIYHPQDGIIDYQHASLHHHLSQTGLVQSLELTSRGDPQFNHMYPLNHNKDEWAKIVGAIQSHFHSS